MFYIEQGIVKLTVASTGGKEVIVDVLGSENFFGESSIAYATPVRFQSAIALTDVSLVKIDGNAIKNALRAASNALYDCISLFRRHDRIRQDFANNLLNFSEKRLARALLSVSKLNNGDRSSFPDITQQDRADMLGITRQRVNILLKQFRKQGFIRDENGLKVDPSIVAVAGKD